MNWLYEDAVFLKENSRIRGCFCLLLCLIDGLAKQEYPAIPSNRNRYTKYLKVKMKDLDIDESVRIEEKGRLLHLSEIIYEYFRCNLVHEGDSRDNLDYEVQVEYEESARFRFNGRSLMDRPNKKIIYKADWLIDILFLIIEKEMGV